MVVTLTGANSFGLQQDLHKLVAGFVEEQGDLALERLDGEVAEIDRIREALTSLPFLASKKMVVLRAPSGQKLFIEKFEQLFGNIPETTEVIIVEPKLDKRSSYYKFLKKTTDFRDFPELDQPGLAQWLVKTAKDRSGSISSVDARHLVERVGASQQNLSNELDKLLLYDAHISRQTINLLTEASPQSTIFQLLEAAFAGKSHLANTLYQEQRALKVEPQQIISMLAWQLHILAIIKTAGERSADTIAQEAKLSPYVVRKSQGVARKLTLQDLRSQISDLVTIDARSKREALDLDDALQLYLLQLGR